MTTWKHVAVAIALWTAGCEGSRVDEVEELLNIGDVSNATTIIESEIQKDPTNLKLRSLSLEAYQAAGEWDKAIETFQVYENLEPTPGRDFRLALLLARARQWGDLKAVLDSWPIARISEEIDR